MITLELSKELNPNLIFDEVCKKYTLNRLNGVLKVKGFVPQNWEIYD